MLIDVLFFKQAINSQRNNAMSLYLNCVGMRVSIVLWHNCPFGHFKVNLGLVMDCQLTSKKPCMHPYCAAEPAQGARSEMVQ